MTARENRRQRPGNAGPGIGLLLVMFALMLAGAAVIALVMLQLVG